MPVCLKPNTRATLFAYLIVSFLSGTAVGQTSDQSVTSVEASTDVNVTVSPQSGVSSMSGGNIIFFSGTDSLVFRQPNSPDVIDVLFSPTTSKFSVVSSSGEFIQTFDPDDILAPSSTLQALSLGDSEIESFDVFASGSGFSGISNTGSMVFQGTSAFFNGERHGTVYICEICFPEAETDGSSEGDLPSAVDVTIQAGASSIPENFLHTYGRITTVNPLTLEIEQDQLIAYTQEAFHFAQERGFDVIQDYSDMVLLAQIPVPASWKISADAVETTSGDVMIAAQTNNRVAVNNGSVVFATGQQQGFSGNTIFSSDGTLYLGDSDRHRTIVRGTLEINDPTAPNHAATRRYVDAMGALSMAMATLPTPAPGRSMFGYSIGHINGESAFSAGFSHAPEHQGLAVRFNLGYSRATGAGGAVGFGHQW